jgi:hypothetical protein
MKQIYPASITGKGFAAGGSVLDHKFGATDPFTLGVEEEYMLLDPETFDLVQHVDTVLTAVQGGEFVERMEWSSPQFDPLLRSLSFGDSLTRDCSS